MEYTRSQVFKYARDTNKDTYKHECGDLVELLNYLANEDKFNGSKATISKVRAWLDGRAKIEVLTWRNGYPEVVLEEPPKPEGR